jgi:hypothetical protein
VSAAAVGAPALAISARTTSNHRTTSLVCLMSIPRSLRELIVDCECGKDISVACARQFEPVNKPLVARPRWKEWGAVSLIPPRP